MAAIKADSGGEEIVAMFLTFLEPKCDIRLLHNLLTAQNIGKVNNSQLKLFYLFTYQQGYIGKHCN